MNANLIRQPISWTMALSVTLHVMVLLFVGIALPDMKKQKDEPFPALDVVLVNAKSKSRPSHADVLAQHNLDGGGNTADNLRATTPLPALDDSDNLSPEQSEQRVKDLEQQVRKLMTQARGMNAVPQQRDPHPTSETRADGDELVRRSLEIARLEAQIDKDINRYQKMPRKVFIGARAREYRFAQYVEDWRSKVERIGNLNYPEAARQQHIYGSLQLTVAIRADGSIESMEVSRSSGQPILDAAAQRIVKMSAPFSPFPPNIRKDTDIISITRTWTFTQADLLESTQ